MECGFNKIRNVLMVSTACNLVVITSYSIHYTKLYDMVELTATPDQIRAFEELAKPFGIIDVARTGVAALERAGA